jgi:trigger factor
MIEKMYGAAIFYEAAAYELIPTAYENAVAECEEEIVSSPQIDLVQIEAGKSFIFTAEVALKPEVSLGKYKGVKVEAADLTVTEEEIDAQIQRERENSARTITVEDRAVKDGDMTVIDFEGFVDGVAFEGGKGTEYALKLGSGSFIPGFEDQLVGCSAGEEKDVIVTFPEEYEPSLAGKEATFKCKVNEVKVSELPELDDEFVKDVSEFDTVEEYKNSIRENLKAARQAQADEAWKSKLLDAAIANMQVEMPESLIEEKLEDMARNYAMNFGLGNVTKAQFCEMLGMDEATFDMMSRPTAEKNAYIEVLLRAVAEAEGIEATEEDFEELCQKLATENNMELDAVKKLVDEAGAKLDIKLNKAADVIYNSGADLPWSVEAEAQSVLDSITE